MNVWKCDYCDFTNPNNMAVLHHEKECRESQLEARKTAAICALIKKRYLKYINPDAEESQVVVRCQGKQRHRHHDVCGFYVYENGERGWHKDAVHIFYPDWKDYLNGKREIKIGSSHFESQYKRK